MRPVAHQISTPHADKVLLEKLQVLETQMTRLVSLLRQERRCISRFEFDRLIALVPEKESCVETLLCCDSDYRRMVCELWRDAGLSTERMPSRLPFALRELACHQVGSIRSLLNRLAERLLALELEILDLQEANTLLAGESLEQLDSYYSGLQQQQPSCHLN